MVCDFIAGTDDAHELLNDCLMIAESLNV